MRLAGEPVALTPTKFDLLAEISPEVSYDRPLRRGRGRESRGTSGFCAPTIDYPWMYLGLCSKSSFIKMLEATPK